MDAKQIKAVLLIAAALGVPAEGLRQVAYFDPPGILTVCRGHTGPDVQKNKVYSLKECDVLFDADMRKAIETVDKCVPGLPVKVHAAFADAVFNLGPKIACDVNHSTAARLLKAGEVRGACLQLPRWNKANVGGFMVPLPGLTTRRHKEMDFCIEGVDEAN